MGERLTKTPHDIPYPPLRALALLAKAHVLLQTYADICNGVDLGAVAACSIMIYGVKPWKLAQETAQLELLDEKEGMVLVDFLDYRRSVICDKEVDCVNEEEDDGEEVEDAEGEAKALMAKAVEEITTWDREIGKRMKHVLDN